MKTIEIRYSTARNAWVAETSDRDLLGFDGTAELAQGFLAADATDAQILKALRRVESREAEVVIVRQVVA